MLASRRSNAGIALFLALASGCGSGGNIQSSGSPDGQTPDVADPSDVPTTMPSDTGSPNNPDLGTGPVDSAGPPPDTGAETSPPETTPANAPYDWIGIIGTGQSLEVGGGPAGNLSTTQSFKNLKLADSGPDPKYPIAPAAGMPQWTAVPLTEPIRGRGPGSGPGYSDGQYPNNIEAETPHSGMASTLSTIWAARGLGDYVSVHTEVGWSGRCLASINKAGGMRAYPASINETRVWKMLAGKAGKTYGVGGIIMTHGECDASNASYAAGVYQLWQDYNADVKAITGQTEDLVMLLSQQSSVATGATGSAVQIWQAGVDHPGQIVCTGPKYQYQYLPDNQHMPAPGYVRMGQKYAEVFDLIVNQKVAWKPLQPTKLSRAGAAITVDFHVPDPPLVWDGHVSPPHQQMNNEWAAGKGFEVSNSRGRLKIASAEIQGNSVVLTLAQDPGAADKITVAYAVTQDGGGTQGGTNLGMRGLLRDSDQFVGHDAEMVDTQVTQGSAAVTSAAAGGFIRRAGWDIVGGTDVPPDTIVTRHESDDRLTLSAPWTKPSGKVKLSYRHDERNFCVHFSMKEP
jgi:hypothetical protein